jgi:hypothetical protein
MGDPKLDRFMRELAAAMDDRTRRIGEHATRTRPRWAIQALGDVPADPARLARWQERAARIGAYREMYGYDAAGEAIGPEPARTSPEARAVWHAAFGALGRVDGIDLRGLSDGQLRLRRALYERETAWAPRHVGEELRLARLQARAAWENIVREDHEARTAIGPDVVQCHEALAGMWRAMESKAGAIAAMLADAQETRRQWEALTEATRRTALAADLELRRRHPGKVLEPLKPAEPGGALAEDQETAAVPPLREEVWVQETLDGVIHLADDVGGSNVEAGQATILTQAQREVHGQQALGLTPGTVGDEIPDKILQIRDHARQAQARIDDLRSTREPAEDDDAMDVGLAWDVLARHDRDAILQPPRPEVVPAREVIRRVQQRRPEHEAEPA